MWEWLITAVERHAEMHCWKTNALVVLVTVLLCATLYFWYPASAFNLLLLTIVFGLVCGAVISREFLIYEVGPISSVLLYLSKMAPAILCIKGVQTLMEKTRTIIHSMVKVQVHRHSYNNGVNETNSNLLEEYEHYTDQIIDNGVLYWYNDISDNHSAPNEIHKILHKMILKLHNILQKADEHLLIQQFITEYHHHFSHYRKFAKNEDVEGTLVNSSSNLHPACSGRTQYIQYLRLISGTLLTWLKPPHVMLSDVSREFLIELITCNFLLKLTDTLCDHNWLNLQLLYLLSETSHYETVVQNILSDTYLPVSKSDAKLGQSPDIEAVYPSLDDSSEFRKRLYSDSVCRSYSKQISDPSCKSVSLLNVPNFVDTERRHSDTKLIKMRKSHTVMGSLTNISVPQVSQGDIDVAQNESHTSVSVESLPTIPMALLSPPLPTQDGDISHQQQQIETAAYPSNETCDVEVEEVKFLLPDESDMDSAASEALPYIVHDSATATDESSLQPITEQRVFDEARSHCALMTSLYKNLIITHTETATEPTATSMMNKYTLYCIQYQCWYISNIGGQRQVSLEKRVVRRRYREFLNLQSRLENDKLSSKLTKGVKGPRRWVSIPFGNMDEKYIESRRVSLQSYLHDLCSLGTDMCLNAHLQEFLAYSSDGRLAFVKYFTKPLPVPSTAASRRYSRQGPGAASAPVIQVPGSAAGAGVECDQTQAGAGSDPLSRRMSGMLDKIKGVLPNPVTVITSSSVNSEGQEDRADVEDVVQVDSFKLAYQNAERCDLSSCLDRLLCDISVEDPTSNMRSPGDGCEHQTTSDEQQERHLDTYGRRDCSEISLSFIDLIITVISATSQPRWTSNSSILCVMKWFLCKPLAIWFEEVIGHYSSQPMLTHYLSCIRVSLWPEDGDTGSERSDRLYRELAHNINKQEYLERETVNALVEFIPGLFKKLLGVDLTEECATHIIHSIQHPLLNRHFVLRVLETLLAEMDKAREEPSK